MKRTYFLCLLMLLCSLAKAQLLYVVSGNNSNAKSYIFATNRLASIEFLDSVPNLFKAFSASDKLITDFALTDYETINALRKAALLPDSVKLEDFYTAEQYQTINQSVMLTLGLSLDNLKRIQPAYLTELYRTELLHRWLGYDENRSSETFFQMVAASQDKPIYSLDDLGETLYMMFEREPFDYQCKELYNIVTYPDREIELEKRLLHFYRNGLLGEIAYEITMPDNHSTLSYSDYQIYARRNLNWTKRLAPYLKEGKAFICLNANYLGGEKGLIADLRAAGYKVRPVNRK